MNKVINKIINRFYFWPFNKILPYNTFQYAFCGGANMFLDLVLFATCYNFVFDKQNIDLGIITVSPYIAAFLIAFFITFFTGFWLMNSVVFCGSPLKNRTKISRYLLVICVNILINYIGLKICVEQLHFYPTPSKILVSLVCVLVSYLSQRHFTFRNYNKKKN